jgi:hypothetical protein
MINQVTVGKVFFLHNEKDNSKQEFDFGVVCMGQLGSM